MVFKLLSVLCRKTFSNSIVKPAPLKQHLPNAHPSMMSKNQSFFETAACLKKQKLDRTGIFWRTNNAALRLAKVKKAL